MRISMTSAPILALMLIIGVPMAASEPSLTKKPTSRWTDEIALPDGAIRLGSAALRFRDGTHGVAFLGNGERFAVINGNRIRIFETDNAKEVRGWKADEYALLAIAATPDGMRIATAGNNEMIRLWEADTGKMLRQFNKHRGSRVFSLAFSPDGKYLVSLGSEEDPQDRTMLDRATDHGLRVWDAENGSEVAAFKDGLPAAANGEFTSDSKHLIWRDGHQSRRHPQFHMRPLAGGKDNVWEVKDTKNWELPFAYIENGLEPRQGGALNWKFVVWDGNKNRELRQYPLDYKDGMPEISFNRICFSPDRSVVATAGESKSIVLWYPAQGTRRKLGPACGLHGLEFSRDGKTLIACGGYDVRLFDVVSGKEHGAIGHRLRVRAVAISPDQKTVATAGDDATVRLCDRATGSERRVLKGHDNAVHSVAFLGNNSLVSGGKDGTLRIWKTDADTEDRKISAHKDGVYSLALPPDGKRLASGGDDGLIRIWDTASWQETKSIRGHEGRVAALVFSPGSQTLYSGSDGTRTRGPGDRREQSFRMWDLTTGNEVRRFPDVSDYAYGSIALSDDGKLAVSNVVSRATNIGNVWDTATGKVHATLPALHAAVLTVAFSPDGKTVAVGCGYLVEHTIVLIDTATWQVEGRLAGHPNGVNALTFSADGRYLVSGGDDGSAVVWDMEKVVRPR